MSTLQGKCAIVTGGADGIGRGTAARLAEAGASVVIADINAEKGQAAADAIQASGGAALFVRCDVGSDADMKALVNEAVKHFGKLDIMVNNAAIDFSKSFLEMEEADWARVININLLSVFRGCRHAAEQMKENGGGSIVNMASAQAHRGFLGYSAYAAAKGGVISLTQQLAVELAPHGIRVNSISPGAIATPMTEQCLAEAEDPDALFKEYVSLHVFPRLGTVDEVADTILFLAGSQSSFITGTDIPIDGGLKVKPPVV